MIDDLLIINEAGNLLYNWHPQGNNADGKDDLLSGFLTAINSFATFERGEDIKSLKMQETTLIFEKEENLVQKLTFVVTTKDESFIELLHAFIHEIMNEFTSQFEHLLNKEFDGDITEYRRFTENVKKTLKSLGLDVLDRAIKEIDKQSSLKSIMILEPKQGNVLFIHAKQYVDKDKISYLIPFVLNSTRLLYEKHLDKALNWILLSTIQNEILIIEPRVNVLLVKQYILSDNLEIQFLSSEFFIDAEKYVKKPKKLIDKFIQIKWDSRIKQFFLIDLEGNIIHSDIFYPQFDFSDYIPETITFLTSTKKTSEGLYNKTLFYAAIGGEKIVTICINFNKFVLTLIGSIEDFNDYTSIQNVCSDIYNQLI